MIPKNPHLIALLARAEAAIPAMEDLTEGLTPDELLWKPEGHVWSIAQIFDHLNMTGRICYPRVRTAIDAAPPGNSYRTGSHRPRLIGRIFIRLSGPGSSIRLRTRDIFHPSAEPSFDVCEEFRREQRILIDLIHDADGLDLRRITVESSRSRFFALGLGDFLEMLLVHQQRHFLQVRRVLDAMEEKG